MAVLPPIRQLLCGFAMETEHLISNARAKLGKKKLDMIAANNLKVEGAGFQTDTNVLTLITQNEEVSLKKMSKEEAAGIILDKLLSLWKCRVSPEENKETETNVYTDEERRG